VGFGKNGSVQTQVATQISTGAVLALEIILLAAQNSIIFRVIADEKPIHRVTFKQSNRAMLVSNPH
jgi:hypothetical protein